MFIRHWYLLDEYTLILVTKSSLISKRNKIKLKKLFIVHNSSFITQKMLSISPDNFDPKDFYQYMIASVAPRPIAWVSTVDENGVPNLAPYSFFNAFSANPPILAFSSSRRGTANSPKDTLRNVEQTMECVINVVSYDTVRQMAITSVEFPPEVSEFEKAGLTPLKSEMVKAFRIKESPVQFECKVRQIVSLGDEPGVGCMVVCDILRMHINENVLDENGRIDPIKIDLMGRLGRAFYTRTRDGLQAVVQPQDKVVIGYDGLAEPILQSSILTANDLGQLAGLVTLPTEIQDFQKKDSRLATITSQEALHTYAKEVLFRGDTYMAAKILYSK
jgi:flavin reductase (DIM6/NTAB) family NADH-FMN oxidoreductase RutF